MMNYVLKKSRNQSNHRLSEAEQAIVKQIQKGNARTFKALMKKYIQELTDFAFYYVESSHTAKDIVQDVFLNIWENKQSWNPTQSVKLYLYKAVKNEALKTLRDKKTERKYMKLFVEEKRQSVVTPEKADQFDDFKQDAYRAIEDLPKRARMVYKLHRREGLTYKEIAKVMDISHKTVESQMSRALKKLRNRLSSYLPALLLAMFIGRILR